MSKLKLISHKLCPYVQRAVIALSEKNVEFERVDIDLANKPEWFKKISPLGKVPLLQVEQDGEVTTLFESAVILEYLEETTPTALHPETPLQRARHRAWIEAGSTALVNIYRLQSAPTLEAVEAEISSLEKLFLRLEDEVQGPFFAGDTFSLVDATFGPVFRFFNVLDEFLPRNPLANTPKVARWREALTDRPSVKSAVAPDYEQDLRSSIGGRTGYLAKQLKGTVGVS